MSFHLPRRPRPVLVILAAALIAAPVAAQDSSGSHLQQVPQLQAAARTAAIELDGRLDEADWTSAPAATDFRQSEPSEGEPATQRTEVRFLFDEDALFIGARMFDTLGADGVRSRLVRRDRDPDSDYISVTFDTFHDHLGRTRFSINPSGVKGDGYGPGGSNEDESWDPVWRAATAIDSLGWTAELRIPLSQLRFPPDSLQTWGLQVQRVVNRLNERSQWAFWRQDEVGGAARFGHLTGVRLAAQPRRAELLPYVVARSAFVEPPVAGDPFRSSEEYDLRIGADLRYLLTSNLTLSGTLNPDFGQVEVDPAVVNLSAFETFFPEKRPFFVEGAGLFDFGGMNCFFCSNASSLNLFYSRRIGRQPQGAALATNAGEFAHVPENTAILGAAKLTGRVGNGISVGVLDAVTRRESAPVLTAGGERLQTQVEPLSNYFAGRVKKDLHGGDVVIGGMATSVVRELGDPGLRNMLNRHAESGGLDVNAWLGERTYRLLASAALSQIAGDSSAIVRAQRSSARYFQRPDREGSGNGLFSDSYDPSAGSMRGWAAYARLSKESGDWLWETALNIRSPGFETNDIAFLTRADYAWMNGNILRTFNEPTSWYRRLHLITGAQQQFNFDGDLTDRQMQAFAYWQPLNYWDVSTFFIHRTATLDDRLLRGGPVVQSPRNEYWALNVSTDSRKTLVLGTNPSFGWNSEGASRYSLNLNLTYRPAANISLSAGPSLQRAESTSQYVAARADPTATEFFGRRYVVADLVQRTASLDTRLNVTFTPALSLEVFAQPFLSSAGFSGFKEFERPRSLAKQVYGSDTGTIRAEGTGAGRRYLVDPDGSGPAGEFNFADPDFNLRSLRGNAVLRWEFLPGSTAFLVWGQERLDVDRVGDLDFGRDRAALFSAHPDNIFLLKVNYWLGL